MNKDQYATVLQQKLKNEGIELSKSAIVTIINSFNESIIEEVSKGGSIQFIGFGTYSALQKKETKCRNPQTGAEITIPARKQPKFAAGSQFRDSVNGKAKQKVTKKSNAAANKKKASPSDSKKKKS